MEETSSEYARAKLSRPAMGLIVRCSISIAVLLLALGFDLFLLLSGKAAEMAQPAGVSKATAILIRMVWSMMIVITNVVIVLGATRMMNVRDFVLARVACILALIPCLGPCFVFGIPFGIWGLVVLNDPRVRTVIDR